MPLWSAHPDDEVTSEARFLVGSAARASGAWSPAPVSLV